MTLDKPKKPNLQDQWAEEQRLKREAAKPPQVNNIDNVISQPIEPKPLTPQERLTSAELAIKTLRAEQELKSVQQGYTNYLEAVKSLETERKAFEEVKTKYPAWQTRELDLNQREANILENEKIADRYCREKRIEGDKYLAEQKRLGDSYYKSSVDKTNKDIKAKTDEFEYLLRQIILYQDNIEPFTRMLMRDSQAIYTYLESYIFPILDSGLVRLVAGDKRNELREKAISLHNLLMKDAENMLTLEINIRKKE